MCNEDAVFGRTLHSGTGHTVRFVGRQKFLLAEKLALTAEAFLRTCSPQVFVAHVWPNKNRKSRPTNCVDAKKCLPTCRRL